MGHPKSVRLKGAAISQTKGGEQVMKRILAVSGFFLALAGAVYAASCTEGNIVVTGQTCTIVNGHCACSGNGN